MINLTIATLIVGFVNVILCILDAIFENWWSFGFHMVISLLFGMVLFQPYNENVRKVLYYIYTVL